MYRQACLLYTSGPAADYCPFSKTNNLCVVVEPADGLETHVYEKAARMAGLKVAAYIGEAGRNLEPDEIITYETRPVFEQAAMYPDLPKVGYIHMLQSQGLLHDTYYYGVDAKQFIPTFMYPTEIMDGAIVSGNCVAPCDKVKMCIRDRYADAAAGRVGVEELKQEIGARRNKDLLMSLGLVPFGKDGNRCV